MSSSPPKLDHQLERLVAMWRDLDGTDPLRRSMLTKLIELIDLTLQVWEEADANVSRLSDALSHAWDEFEIDRTGYPGLAVYPLMLITGPDGKIVRTNRDAETTLGLTMDEIVGRNLIDLVVEDSQKRVRGAIVAPFGAQQTGAFDLVLRGSDGSRLPFRALISVAADSERELLGIYWWLLPGQLARGERTEDLLDTQERLRATFEQAVVAMAHLTLDGEWFRVNDAMCELLCGNCSDVMTRPFRDYLHPEDHAHHEERLAALLRGEVAGYALDVRFISREAAEPVWLRETVSLLRAEDGAAAYLVVVLEDISRRRRMEDSLLDALESARNDAAVGQNITMASAVPDVLDALMEASSLSRAGAALVLRFSKGQAPDDVPPESLSVQAVWSQDDTPPVRVGYQYLTHTYRLGELLSGSQPVLVEDVASDVRLNDELRALLASLGRAALLLPLTAGARMHGLLVVGFPETGIFDAKEIPYLLQIVRQASAAIYTILLLKSESAARREAERANAMKMRLLATISHELRTPLTPIKGFASTLLAEDVEWEPEMQRDFISTINDEADKLGDLIDQLLDLSRLEAGQLRFTPKPCTLDDILDNVLPELTMLGQDHTLHLSLGDVSQQVYADPDRIAQVLANLVNNAAKYSPAGTRITVSARPERGYMRVSVTDEGAGIDAGDRERLFEPFVQGDPRKARSRQGAGLGLAISRGIVLAHGGRIWVEDDDGEGTTVTFTVPVFQA